MNTSNMITHYTILFSMYLGMELQKSQALFDQITGDDPELIDSAMTDWAAEFVRKGLDDSASFFDQKFKEYIHANYPEEDRYVYVVTGNGKNDDGSDEEWLVEIFGDEQRAAECQKELQRQADEASEDPDLQCDPIKYLIERRVVK